MSGRVSKDLADLDTFPKKHFFMELHVLRKYEAAGSLGKIAIGTMKI